MTITVGADVELFGKTKVGHHTALCGKIGGTKENPRQLEEARSGFMVQEDNVSLEYNIPPASNVDEFVFNIAYMRDKTAEILAKLGLFPSVECAVSFDEEELASPQAQLFGCEPDYDAWTKVENRRPVIDDESLRTAGGHVHVGSDNVDMIAGIRAMDLFLGVPSVILDGSPNAAKRRLRYGKAGAMRPKPYGFEYRVLSNFWMFSDVLTSWVFNQTWYAMEFVTNGKTITNIEAEKIQRCINTGDIELAKELITMYGLKLPKVNEVYTKAKDPLDGYLLDIGKMPKFKMPIHIDDFIYTFNHGAIAGENNAVPIPAWTLDDVLGEE